MIDLLLIPLTAICNRFRGGGVIDKDIPARKLISGVVLAAICALFAKNIWVFPIILAGWYLRNIVGTGFLFEAIHGWTAPKWKGVLYGTARGLLTLATTIPLAALFYFTGQDSNINNCILLSLLGLLGALQGIIYYIAGKIVEETKFESVTVAELIDGALYGLILAAIL